ncbi:hypothetical protein RBI22_15300 [Alcaligenaceae bacterium C4P045]|nr:hypothetical protein [Alcaligenaceae bacterium C4P045]
MSHLYAVPLRPVPQNLPVHRTEVPMRAGMATVRSSQDGYDLGAVYISLGMVAMSLTADEALVLGESIAAAARHHKAAVASAEAQVS